MTRSRYFLSGFYTTLLLLLCACSQFGERSPFGIHEFNLEGEKAGINVTDASRRIAVIYPDGSICSEGSPAAMMSNSIGISNAVSAKSSSFEASQSGGYNSSSQAQRLSAQSERIQCLNIALFHACGLNAMTDANHDKVFDLYLKLVDRCAKWSEPKEPSLGQIERILKLNTTPTK